VPEDGVEDPGSPLLLKNCSPQKKNSDDVNLCKITRMI
jgi:hypothetical protein